MTINDDDLVALLLVTTCERVVQLEAEVERLRLRLLEHELHDDLHELDALAVGDPCPTRPWTN